MSPFGRTAFAFILIFVGSAPALTFAWTGPSGSPPNNNASAPVNIGSTFQEKSGGAWFDGGVGVNTGNAFCIGTSCITSWAQAGAASQWTTSGSSIYYDNGNVGIGTTIPDGELDVENGSLCLNGSCISSWPSSGVGGSGTSGYVTRFTGATTLGTSTISDNGSSATASGNFFVDGTLYIGNSTTYLGAGTFSVGADNTLAVSNSGSYSVTTNGSFTANPWSTASIFTVNEPAGFNIPTTDSNGVMFENMETGAGSVPIMYFLRNGTSGKIGSITITNTATSYNTTSDRRLKENIATSTEGLATLMQIAVDNFDFINDPLHTVQQGFIAQQLEPIYPEAVTTNGDNGIVPLSPSSTPWQVDYGRLTPLIVSAVQDIANISSTFQQNLIAWLGDASNGIQDFYATTIHTKNLCAEKSDGTEICVTGDQLAALLAEETPSAYVEARTSSP